MPNTPYQLSQTPSFGLSGIYQLAFSYPLASLANGSILTGYTIPHDFRLLDIRTVVTGAGAGAGATATITASIAGTAVPGAVITPTLANTATLGTTAISTATAQLSGGNQDGAAGAALSLAASAVTAFTGGTITLILTIRDKADA